MRTPDYHDPLTCSDLNLDQAKLDDAYIDGTDNLISLLAHYFGRVQSRLALEDRLERDLKDTLHAFAQKIIGVVADAYVTKALADTREATANMFEALAAGASVAHRAGWAGEDAGDVVHAFATIAACEGRPEILTNKVEEIPAQP